MEAKQYRLIRSVMETPILDERKWAKIPQINADAFFLDLEDSVPQEGKTRAREKAVAYLQQPEYFGRGTVLIARPNSLNSPWGEEDLTALVEAGAKAIAYPKITGVEDVEKLSRRVAELGAQVDILPIIETAGALVDLDKIARMDNVKGLMFGPSDFASDVGFAMFSEGRFHMEAYYYARSKVVIHAAARGLASFEAVFVPDMRDVAAVADYVQSSKAFGFSGLITFYPPHVKVINEMLTPSNSDIEEARDVVAQYEAAVAAGAPAVQHEGRVLIVHDYHNALGLLRRAEAFSAAANT